MFYQVSLLYSSTVVCDLLQSCYTGVLQFSPEEIVNYLTAASYLQMEHIVERCRGALKKYMQLKNPSPPKFSDQKVRGSHSLYLKYMLCTTGKILTYLIYRMCLKTVQCFMY